MQRAPDLRLSGADLHRLVELMEGASPARAQRARCLILSHWGHPRDAIARDLSVPVEAVAKWQAAYAEGGLAQAMRLRERARKEADARKALVRGAVATLGGERRVRDVARATGLPVSTTFRLLQELFPAPARAPRPPRAPPRELPARPPAASATGPPPPVRARVVVVGCGGAGGRVIDRLAKLAPPDATTVAIDTDKAALDATDADTKLLIGKSLLAGRGAGGSTELGARAATLARDALTPLFEGAPLVLVVAGLGGGTGTGAAPVVAAAARKAGAVVAALVTTPFQVERPRAAKADAGLVALAEVAHTRVLLANDRLLALIPDIPMRQAFVVMDALLAEAAGGLVASLSGESVVGLDLQEVREHLRAGARATLLHGEARSADPRRLVEDAFAHAFSEARPARATGAIAQLVGGSDVDLALVEGVSRELEARLAPGGSVLLGARAAPEGPARIRLTIVLTGT